jgi:hypothetical protein
MSTWTEQRRLDRAAEAEQAREDRRLELEAAQAARDAAAARRRDDEAFRREEQRKAADAKRRQQRDEQRQRDAKKAAAKAAAAAKRARMVRWLKTNPATLFVAFVMVASIIPAVISQVAALSGARVHGLLAALLAAMLEGGAWAITFMGKQAEDAGRETRKYRIATWGTAAVAAAVNFWHGLEAYSAHPWVAVVLAGSSLFAIYIWDMKTHGSHGPSRADRRREKARRKHLAARRKHHKDIACEADQLIAALPFGAITEEEAFAAAWRIRKGAEPGLSAEVYAAATNSRVQLGAAFELGEHVRPELLRNGLMAAALNPLPGVLPRLGPVSPLPSLAGTSDPATSQAGIGLYALPRGSRGLAGEKSPERPAGRSHDELELMLPEALRVSAELVAEGRQISAAQLSKRLQIRREDAVVLRDLVVAQRKDQYRTAAASDGIARQSVSARVS